MRRSRVFALLSWLLLPPCISCSEDLSHRVRKAVEQITLDQPGTPPFHLKATLAPSLERDRDSERTGEVEIWWTAPDKWKREVRSPSFHQIEVVNGASNWQRNEGEVYPEWLREIAIALARPVPDVKLVTMRLRSAETREILGTTHVSWTIQGTDGMVTKTIGAGLNLRRDGSIEFFSDLGWNVALDQFAGFHQRNVARKISGDGLGGPEVTARVTLLEDLSSGPELFQTAGESSPRLQTATFSELEARKNLQASSTADWPRVKDGPLEGAIISEILVDREGNVAEVGTTLSDNPGLIDAAKERIHRMRFKPFILDGHPVCAITTITMPFKAARPAGVENFDSARNYFEQGRKVGFPAVSSIAPYVLTSTFQVLGTSGKVETGTYTDTFVNETQWRREALLANSRVIRTRNGDKRYLQSEGPDARILAVVLMVLEPIPAIDTFVESDWRIQRENGTAGSVVRVASGHENPDGTPDPGGFRGYWFDSSGQLLRAYTNGLEIERADFVEFDGAQIAQRVNVLAGGRLAMQITVTGKPAGTLDPKLFVLKGHEWERRFTAEAR